MGTVVGNLIDWVLVGKVLTFSTPDLILCPSVPSSTLLRNFFPCLPHPTPFLDNTHYYHYNCVHLRYIEVLIPSTDECELTKSFLADIVQVKMRSLGWPLNQHTGILIRKREIWMQRETHTPRDQHVMMESSNISMIQWMPKIVSKPPEEGQWEAWNCLPQKPQKLEVILSSGFGTP